MSITNVKNIIDKVMIPYILVYELMLTARLVGVYSLIPSKFDTIIFSFLALLGLIIIFINFCQAIKEKNYYRYNYLLVFFIIAIVVSTFISSSSNLMSNLKLILWQILLMFIVYDAARIPNAKKLFNYAERLLLVASFVIIIISLGMFFLRFTYVEKVDNLYYGLRMGFFENRLYGLFYDPNFGATISVVSIVLSVKRIYQHKALYRSISMVNVIIQLFYVALSGSRTALLELIIISGTGTFFIIYQISKERRIYPKLLKSVLSLIIVSLMTLLLITGIKKISISLVNLFSNDSLNFVVENTNKRENNSEDEVTLTRKDVSKKEDISNDRFELWKSAVEIFKTTPVFGTTSRNLVSYARSNLPDNYIGKSAHTPHNFFFYLLATTGLLGTLPFMIFLFRRIWQSLNRLFIVGSVFDSEFLFDNLVVLTILVSASFLTDIVMVNRIGGFLFWLYLGKIVANFTQKETVI